MGRAEVVSPSFGVGLFYLLYIVISIGLVCITVYVMILLIKLAKRGIKALDIYLDKNNS